MGMLDMVDTVLVFGDARREKLKPNQKVNPKPMPGYTITPMEYGHHGMLDMVDMVLVFGDARREKLKPSQKVNPKPMPGYTIILMEYGHHGMLDMVDTVLVFGDARREKLNQSLLLMLTPKPTTSCMEYGQLGTLDITVLTDGNGDIAPANYSHFP